MASRASHSRPRYETSEADTPLALAFRMAGYIKDARYIAAYVAQEYGPAHAPSVARVMEMQAQHERPFRKRQNEVARERERERQRAAAQAEREAEQEAELAARIEQQRKDAEALEAALAGFNSKQAGIVSAVAFAFAITPATLVGKSRKKRHVRARQVAIRLLRDRQIKVGKLSLPNIGKLIGGRDHSTIKHSLDTFDVMARHHPEVAAIYERLKGLAVQ